MFERINRRLAALAKEIAAQGQPDKPGFSKDGGLKFNPFETYLKPDTTTSPTGRLTRSEPNVQTYRKPPATSPTWKVGDRVRVNNNPCNALNKPLFSCGNVGTVVEVGTHGLYVKFDPHQSGVEYTGTDGVWAVRAAGLDPLLPAPIVSKTLAQKAGVPVGLNARGEWAVPAGSPLLFKDTSRNFGNIKISGGAAPVVSREIGVGDRVRFKEAWVYGSGGPQAGATGTVSAEGANHFQISLDLPVNGETEWYASPAELERVYTAIQQGEFDPMTEPLNEGDLVEIVNPYHCSAGKQGRIRLFEGKAGVWQVFDATGQCLNEYGDGKYGHFRKRKSLKLIAKAPK